MKSQALVCRVILVSAASHHHCHLHQSRDLPTHLPNPARGSLGGCPIPEKFLLLQVQSQVSGTCLLLKGWVYRTWQSWLFSLQRKEVTLSLKKQSHLAVHSCGNIICRIIY